MSKDFVLHKQVKIKLYEQKHFKVIMITFSSLDINCHKKINIIKQLITYNFISANSFTQIESDWTLKDSDRSLTSNILVTITLLGHLTTENVCQGLPGQCSVSL